MLRGGGRGGGGGGRNENCPRRYCIIILHFKFFRKNVIITPMLGDSFYAAIREKYLFNRISISLYVVLVSNECCTQLTTLVGLYNRNIFARQRTRRYGRRVFLVTNGYTPTNVVHLRQCVVKYYTVLRLVKCSVRFISYLC